MQVGGARAQPEGTRGVRKWACSSFRLQVSGLAAPLHRWLMEGCEVREAGPGHTTRGRKRRGKKDGAEQRCAFWPQHQKQAPLRLSTQHCSSCARLPDLPPT